MSSRHIPALAAREASYLQSSRWPTLRQCQALCRHVCTSLQAKCSCSGAVHLPFCSWRIPLVNVTALQRSIALPDMHSGYGFAIGNVAAFDMSDPDAVVSPGGVGFDINCGVRLIRTNLVRLHPSDDASWKNIQLEAMQGIFSSCERSTQLKTNISRVERLWGAW